MDPQHSSNQLVHRLLHPGERDRFAALCRPTSAVEFPALRASVDAHLALAEAAEGALVDVEVGRQVAGALNELLDNPNGYDDEQRALIRGAVDYFVLTGDDADDLSDPTGFDDDARIVNAVAQALDRADLIVKPGLS